MHRISGWPGIWPENPPFLICSIRPDTGFDLLDIRLDTGAKKTGHSANRIVGTGTGT
jgi:hypothetical protein